MPIYLYKCSACGLVKDVLQKFSEAALTVCPGCHADTLSKQVTAASFQLKGTGWYVTDFRDNGKPKEASQGDSAGHSKPSSADAKPGSPSAANVTTSTPAAAPTPAEPSATSS
jgi:putative FmdB family regulatory protein